jgi:hypothetical protein
MYIRGRHLGLRGVMVDSIHTHDSIFILKIQIQEVIEGRLECYMTKS